MMRRAHFGMAMALAASGCRREAPLPIEIAVVVDEPVGSADEAVRTIAAPLESAVAGLPGLLEVRSTSSPDAVVVTCRFAADAPDPATAVRARIEGRRPAVGIPVIQRIRVDDRPVRYFLAAPALDAVRLLELHDELVRPRLEALVYVSAVTSCGGATRETIVEVDPQRLVARGVTLDHVLAAFSASVDLPGGRLLDTPGQQIRLQEPLDDADLANRLVGDDVRLGDVATVRGGVVPAPCSTLTGIVGAIASYADPREVARLSRATIPQIRARLPAGVRLALLGPTVRLEIMLPLGVPVAQRLRTVARAAAELRTLAGVKRVLGTVDDARAEVLLELRRGAPSVRDVARAALGKLEPEPGIQVRALDGVPELTVRVAGDDPGALDRATDAVAQQLRRTSGVEVAHVNGSGAVPEIQLDVNRDRIAAAGLATSDVARVVEALTAGVEVGRQVRVRLGPAEAPADVASRLRTPVAIGRSGPVALSDLVTVREGLTPEPIERVDGRRVRRIRAQLTDFADPAAILRTVAQRVPLPAGVVLTTEGR